MYMVCRLMKRNGRYVIGPLSFTTGNPAEAMTYAKRAAQSARWRRIIPAIEIDATDAKVLRAWETYDTGGIAVITNDPAQIRRRAVSPIGGAP
jgi:hypothetical protein